MAKEFKLSEHFKNIISTDEADVWASYRFALFRESYKNAFIDYKLMGFCQDIQLQEYRTTQVVREIGSLLTYYLPGPFQSSLSLNKILIFDEAIISATRDNVSKLEMDLFKAFGKSTNFILFAFAPKDGYKLNNTTGIDASIVGKVRMEKARIIKEIKIQDKSLNIVAGQPVIVESATFLFSKIEDVA